MPESTEGQAIAPAPAPSSIPPARDPSPGVRVTQQIREALTDLGGLALAAYLVSRGAITGLHALYFAVVLLLPSPVLLRVAKIIGARGSSAGAGVAVALLSASAAWAHTKAYVVAGAGVLGLAACLGGCSAATPHLQAIPPSIVERTEYGTCAETGGKIEVPRAGVLVLLTSVCWRSMDAGVADASAVEDPAPAVDKSDSGVMAHE